MLKRGEVYENPVTGERSIIRIGTAETNGEHLISDLYLRPGAAVVGEHFHPKIYERFTVVVGRIEFVIDGQSAIAETGRCLEVPPGVSHDWWNAGTGEAHVIVEIWPASRFEEMLRNFWGLAQDGKTNRKGRPNLLQLSLTVREFADVIQFTRPPLAVQKILFAVLAPISRFLGLRGSYSEYLTRGPSAILPVVGDSPRGSVAPMVQ